MKERRENGRETEKKGEKRYEGGRRQEEIKRKRSEKWRE